jgi:hypothetical protein
MVNCSNRNCNYNIPPDYFINHYAYEKIKLYSKQINENEYKYEKILDSLIKTELCCITCCVKQTTIICNNFNIPKKNYSIGYTHKPDKI